MSEVFLPVYSALDMTEEVVDPFSQSFSPFLLLERLGDRKPSAESGLKHTHTYTSSVRLPFCMVAEYTVGKAGNDGTTTQGGISKNKSYSSSVRLV